MVRSRRSGILRAVLLLTLGMFLPWQSNADVIYPSSRALVQAGTNGDPLSVVDTGFLPDDSAGPVSLFKSGLGTASAFADVSDGTLSASATASSSSDPTGQTFEAASAYGLAQYLDSFMLFSDSLAIGEPVNILLTLETHYSISGECVPGSAVAWVDAKLIIIEGGSGPFPLQFRDSTCDGDDVNHTSGVLTALIGSTITFMGQLEVSALHIGGGVTGADDPFCAGLCDDSSGLPQLRFFIDPLGDFGYVTASGNSYLSSPAAVPEPTSLLLLGAGTVGVLAKMRRRKNSQS